MCFACGSSLPCGQATHAAAEQPGADPAKTEQKHKRNPKQPKSFLGGFVFCLRQLLALRASHPRRRRAARHRPSQNRTKQKRNPKQPKSLLGHFRFLPAAAPCPAGKPPKPHDCFRVPEREVDNDCHLDTLGFEPRAFRVRSGCETTTPCAPLLMSAPPRAWRAARR